MGEDITDVIFISIEIENKELRGWDTKQKQYKEKKNYFITYKDIVVYTIENINISL